MNIKLVAVVCFSGLVLFSCSQGMTEGQEAAEHKASVEANKLKTPTTADPDKGLGKFAHVVVGPLDASMASNGEKIYAVKCASCHKLTDEKLVGPGWKGVSIRNKPEWIMNFVTNTEEMINSDPKAMAMLEICIVRMPNQEVNDNDARALLEFMRKNDGAK